MAPSRRELLLLGASLPLAGCARTLGAAGEGAAENPALAAARAEFARLAPPGAAVALVSGDATPPTAAMGVEDLERGNPATRETVFQIASLTKPFTAMAILLLAERGTLALDAPAARWLDWLPAAYGGVTLRHLLTHTSGVPRDLRRENVDEFTMDEFRTRFLAAAPAFAPGERWEYANSGYTLLSLLAERAAGRPFGDLLRTLVFAPLGLTVTRYRAPLVRAPGRATGYDRGETGWAPAPPVYSGFGNSGIETDIVDLGRFARALHRRRLLRPESYAQMLAPARLASGAELRFPFRGAEASYGFGWFLGTACGDPIAFHGGTIAGFSSQLVWNTRLNLSAAALSNGKALPDRSGVAEKLAAAGYAALSGCAASS